MAPLGVALIGGGIFAKQEHMVRTASLDILSEIPQKWMLTEFHDLPARHYEM